MCWFLPLAPLWARKRRRKRVLFFCSIILGSQSTIHCFNNLDKSTEVGKRLPRLFWNFTIANVIFAPVFRLMQRRLFLWWVKSWHSRGGYLRGKYDWSFWDFVDRWSHRLRLISSDARECLVGYWVDWSQVSIDWLARWVLHTTSFARLKAIQRWLRPITLIVCMYGRYHIQHRVTEA